MDVMLLVSPVLNMAQQVVDAFLAPINFVMRVFKHDPVTFDVTDFAKSLF